MVAYATQNPAAAALALVFWLCRGFLPDPVVWLRTMGRIDATEDFNNIVVATKNGTPIRVADLGYAEDSSERPTSSVWHGDKPAVLLDIRRAMGENTVAVIEGVRARLVPPASLAAPEGLL